jgi:hypothetical protein
MQYTPIFSYKKKVVIFDLNKPIYGSFYGIWEKWLKKAGKLGFKLVINTSLGTSTYKNVDEFMDGAERLERFYKNPDVPMVFWGRHLKPDVDQRKKRKKLEKHIVEDVSIPFDVLERLRGRAQELGII